MTGKNAAFTGLCLGFFIVMMDTTTVPLVYATLMDTYHVSPVTVAWVNNIYFITYAAFLLPGGRLGDSLDRKKVLLTAFVTIACGAALSGTDHSLTQVILGRALMGMGAGLLTPQTMAYISILFAGGGRGTALGIWGAVAGVATAIGPVVTQAFLAMGDWRWVMWINVPLALVGLLVTQTFLPRSPGHGFKLSETATSAFLGLGLGAAALGLQIAAEQGTAIGLALGLCGLVLLWTMARRDIRSAAGAILSPGLWRDTTFLRTCLISALLGMGLTAFYLPLSFLLGVRLDLGPVGKSVVMVTIALASACVGPVAGRLSDRLVPETIVRTGLILFALANGFLGLIAFVAQPGQSVLPVLIVVMIIAGAGTGLAFAPLANIALGQAHHADIGRAAAFFSTVRQTLSAFGGVLVALIFDGVIRLQLGATAETSIAALSRAPRATAFACFTGFVGVGLFLLAGAALSRSPAHVLRDAPSPR